MDFETLMRAKAELEPRVKQLCGHLDAERKALELEQIEEKASAPGFWDDPEAAKPVLKARGLLTDDIATSKKLSLGLDDLETALELSRDDADMLVEAEAVEQSLREGVEAAELRMMLSGDLDQNNAIVAIAPGAGGTESCDWAEMLLRMYRRWGERRKFKVETLEYQDGDTAGIKSATLQFKGHNAYGWLKTESGVHRLVRISPYDSNARRHTSFSSIWVYPVIDDSINIEINESDCRIDTYRSSGAGGQHVNTTDSAVRITHIPTGIVVACQQERSQHKNRAKAWDMLRARMYEAELKKREEAANAEAASKSDIGWGHQIRSYVLQPYQLVKDMRTGVESTAPSDVLDGELNEFMEAALAHRVNGGADAVVDDLN